MDPDDVELEEVLFEFIRVGKAVRVVAIDPESGTEIVMVGARGYSEDYLKRLATRKLIYAIAKRRRKAGEG
ncbi:MAG: hypothetical protein EXQ86_08265 [Rhodospirillales bacterium]|nr:hypothetical protein [Rhodospirillales bacterium]